MEVWQRISLILCTFGFFKELRPSEPFITEYIIDYKNVTAEEAIHVAFPVSTYSALLTLAIVFLITDLVRYRLIVILEGFIYIVTWVVLILGENLTAIIWVEVFYGIACSTEVAYYTYIYAQVKKEHYKVVTSHTSSALYTGKFVGGILAQILVTFHLMNYHEMTYLTLGFSVLGFIATLFLPKVATSIYFNRQKDASLDLVEESQNEPNQIKQSAFSRLWEDFKDAYSNSSILKWSLWWAFASAGQYQVVNYVQTLWVKINEENQLEPYNGVVKALHTFLSAILCLGVGYVKLDWNRWGESLLGVISLLQGGLLVWMARSSYLYVAYFCYTVFRTIHPVMLTLASSEVAHGINKDSHGLIFGMNIFVALFLQTILTIVISDEKGFALDVQLQFVIYGAYFVILGTIFVLVSCWSSASIICLRRSQKSRQRSQLNDKSDETCSSKFIDNIECSDQCKAPDERL